MLDKDVDDFYLTDKQLFEKENTHNEKTVALSLFHR